MFMAEARGRVETKQLKASAKVRTVIDMGTFVVLVEDGFWKIGTMILGTRVLEKLEMIAQHTSVLAVECSTSVGRA